ncbi:MAG: hypothetical protein J5I47_02670 [Vicingus serpentipes]|nr:hypothetical protein [Vicingus serpentipes]
MNTINKKMSGIITVKNISIESTEKCNCGSWLNHWNNFNNKPPVFCSEIRCTHMFHLFGAHVQKVEDDENWYIIPLCEKHGRSDEELVINNFVKFIPADINKTCG